jgi:NhaC family Na+:H+ antiporter
MKRKPTFLEGLSTIIALGLFIFIGYTMFKIRIEPLLIGTAAYSFFIAKRLGYNWAEMEYEIIEKIKKSMPALLILVSVGIVIGTWIYSGTVPMMIYYGLKIISPKLYLVTAFLITAIISTVTGTSWGSVGTAGVALIGVATGLGIPLPQAAGAIISGAVFGDKMSPLSDTTNMAALVTETDLYDHIKHMFYTTIPAATVGMIVWFIVGLKGIGQEVVLPDAVSSLTTTLDMMYNWNIILLIPPIIVLYGAISKKPTVPTMLAASLVALIVGTFVQGFSIVDGLKATVSGFNVSMVNVPGFDPDTASKSIINLLNRGGMMSMADMVIIIFCAMAYAGIVQSTGCLEVILKSFEKKIKSTGQLILVTIASSVIMVSAVGLASVSAIFVGELFTDTYKRKGLHTKNLSRTIEDAGTMIVSIIPWSGSGLFYLATLGVPATEYWIWAIPCYLGIVFAAIYGFTGIGITKHKYETTETEEIVEK